ncbi:MAG: FeoA domain-containing protein [Verrucomicrobia bacterium]|nr:FeoA domain-containing protein [Verrucomicrobiota bacterium]HOX03533.1 iron dependent repressor, metal binding and dimerization domain protein [Verrucomicrobiota bacterium]
MTGPQTMMAGAASTFLSPGWALAIGVAVLGMICLAVWPRWGLWDRWRRYRTLRNRILSEDALKHLHRCERERCRATIPSLAGALQVSPNHVAEVLGDMERRGLISVLGEEIQLAATGRAYALSVIRAHRLWERHLAEQTGVAEKDWHRLAERHEHFLSPEAADALSARLGHPTHDPHGDPIPTAGGEWVAHGGKPLSALGILQTGRIVHLEDEPPAIYEQLTALGLYPNMRVRLLEAGPGGIRFWAEGDEHLLTPLAAANISVVPEMVEEEIEAPSGSGLHLLKPGESARVVGVSPRCRGPERRRLLDLGIVPGTVIAAELASPGGDPIAYRIRGALIALRREQARLIQVARGASEAAAA